jgi:hypothetical protein
MRVIVDRRVMELHPELAEQDVIHAVKHEIGSRLRLGTFPAQTAGVGMDGNGRLVEWVKIPLDGAGGQVMGGWFVYHAMTPPTKKMLREVGLI